MQRETRHWKKLKCMHLKVTREKEQEGQEDGSLNKSTCCQSSCSESEIHTVEGESWFSQVVLWPSQEWHDMCLSPYTTHTHTQMKSINVLSEGEKWSSNNNMHLASHASLSTPPHTAWTKQFLKFPRRNSRGLPTTIKKQTAAMKPGDRHLIFLSAPIVKRLFNTVARFPDLSVRKKAAEYLGPRWMHACWPRMHRSSMKSMLCI